VDIQGIINTGPLLRLVDFTQQTGRGGQQKGKAVKLVIVIDTTCKDPLYLSEPLHYLYIS
jgi:hypothetical protein